MGSLLLSCPPVLSTSIHCSVTSSCTAPFGAPPFTHSFKWLMELGAGPGVRGMREAGPCPLRSPRDHYSRQTAAPHWRREPGQERRDIFQWAWWAGRGGEEC